MQRSLRNGRQCVVFTVNLGIVSRRLYEFEGYHVPIEKLTEAECHWRQRLGHLTPANKDTWWTVDETTSPNEFGAELLELIDRYALPEMTKFIEDEHLAELWLSVTSPGLTNAQRLEYLSVMLKSMGRLDLLPGIITVLRKVAAGTPYSRSAEVHIKLLSERIP